MRVPRHGELQSPQRFSVFIPLTCYLNKIMLNFFWITFFATIKSQCYLLDVFSPGRSWKGVHLKALNTFHCVFCGSLLIPFFHILTCFWSLLTWNSLLEILRETKVLLYFLFPSFLLPTWCTGQDHLQSKPIWTPTCGWTGLRKETRNYRQHHTFFWKATDAAPLQGGITHYIFTFRLWGRFCLSGLASFLL